MQHRMQYARRVLSSKIMKNTSLLYVFIVFFSYVHAGLHASYCNDVNYTTINDPRRSTAFVNTDPDICDREIIEDNEWYRFTSEAGGEMATELPKQQRCGTKSPIWMKGSHPAVEEGAVNRTACASAPFAPCAYSYDIKVRNCSGFYIYQLKEPARCDSAYCAGSKLVNCTNARPEDYCLENRPPYISMPDRLYAFENSEFQLFINATDPEGYPLSYDYVRNNTVSNVSVDKTLVKIYLTKSGRVSLKVTDKPGQGATTIHTIDIVALPRLCQTGKCKNNITVSTKREDLLNYTCDCVKPYIGKCCEISPCDKLPCFPGLNCIVTADGYTCEKCPSRFEGDGKRCKLLSSEDTVTVKAEFTIVSGLKWNPDLLNKTSFVYKQQTVKIVTEIIQVYRNTNEFVHVVDLGYSKGSVVVEFQIVLKKKMTDPLEPLRTRVKNNGKLGSFKVDASSVKEKKTSVPPKEKLYFGLHKTVFIIVMFLVSILAFTAIVVCGICIKKKHVNIIVLCMNDERRDIVLTNSNVTDSNAGSRKQKPSRNQVMDIQSVVTSSVATNA